MHTHTHMHNYFQVVVVNNPHVSRVLPDSVKEIGRALLYRGDIVEAVLEWENLKEKVIDRLMAQLGQECRHLCSLKFNSLLRKCTPKQLCDFNMDDLALEWQQQATLLHQFLLTASSSASAPNTTNIPPVCMAGSILLRARNIHMSAVQHLVGLLLFHGNASKQVCVHYYHFGWVHIHVIVLHDSSAYLILRVLASTDAHNNTCRQWYDWTNCKCVCQRKLLFRKWMSVHRGMMTWSSNGLHHKWSI